jgi:hypothetical protein
MVSNRSSIIYLHIVFLIHCMNQIIFNLPPPLFAAD